MHVLTFVCLIDQGIIEISTGKVSEFCVSGNTVVVVR